MRKKCVLLAISIFTVFVSVALYIVFYKATFKLPEPGEFMKHQDYRWAIQVLFSIGIGLTIGTVTTVITNRKRVSRFEKFLVIASAILTGALICFIKLYTYQLVGAKYYSYDYVIMLATIGISTCLITFFSFKIPSYVPSEYKTNFEVEKETDNKSHPDISFEIKSEENEIVNLRFMYDKFIQNLKSNTNEVDSDYDFDIKDKYKLLDDQTIVFVKNGESKNQYIIFRKKDNELFVDEFFCIEEDNELIFSLFEKFFSEQGAEKVTILLPDYEQLKNNLIAFVGKYSGYNYICNNKTVSFEVR